MPVIGLLLAAGHGRRFDPEGRRSKLEVLLDGEPVAIHALRSLAAACDRILAVCRPDQPQLIAALRMAGHEVEVASELRSFARTPDEGVSPEVAEGEIERLRRLLERAGIPWRDEP